MNRVSRFLPSLLRLTSQHLRHVDNATTLQLRPISTTALRLCEPQEQPEQEPQNAPVQYARNTSGMKRKGKVRPTYSWQKSARYMRSDVFASTYGEHKIWELYRRNVPGANIWYKQPKTRRTCLSREAKLITNWPCPVCRDEYLVLHYRNTKLLEQFLDESTGEVMPCKKVYLCQEQYERLCVAVMKAHDCGTLTFRVPHREYDYREFYPDWADPPEALIPATPLQIENAFTYKIYPVFNPERKPIDFVYDVGQE